MENLRLHLIRHAKSDWNHEQISDHDRPLNNRGLKDARIMSKRFHENFETPDYWSSSTAIRAKSTLHFFAQSCGLDESQVILEKDLYLASLQTFIDLINTIPRNAKSAVMFGHNPGISEISTYLSNEYVEMPTCCIVSLEFNLEGWGMVSGRTGNLVKLDYPQNTLL